MQLAQETVGDLADDGEGGVGEADLRGEDLLGVGRSLAAAVATAGGSQSDSERRATQRPGEGGQWNVKPSKIWNTF